jgi:hypothetical protein
MPARIAVRGPTRCVMRDIGAAATPAATKKLVTATPAAAIAEAEVLADRSGTAPP